MDSYKLQPHAKSQLQPITTVLSEFNRFREEGFLLVDKTALINDLIDEGRVFLSRPRRFGKSLLLSTIAELYTNGVKNFEGFAIHDSWQQDRYPVVDLSFFGLSDPETLESHLCSRLRTAFAMAGFGAAFEIGSQINTIFALSGRLDYLLGQQDIVLLIDECDFPLSSQLYNPVAFEKNKAILNKFYAWLRNHNNIEFLMLTGIARYQDSSLFCGQTITDISMDPRYADLLGYTQEEVEYYFADHIKEAAARFKISTDELCHKLAAFYKGFCFNEDAQGRLYCPLSINEFFDQFADPTLQIPQFGYYWFESSNSSPALHNFLNHANLKSDFLDQVQGSGVELSQAAISNACGYRGLDFEALLVQTGYLSIDRIKNPAEASMDDRICCCKFPNTEVELPCINIFLKYFTGVDVASWKTPWFRQNKERLKEAFLQQDMEQVVVALNTFLRAIREDLWSNATEFAYRTFIEWCLLSSLRYLVQQKDLNHKGSAALEFDVGSSHYVIVSKLVVPSNGQEQGQGQVQDSEGLRLLADETQKQVYERVYGSNAQNGAEQQCLGLALVVSAENRQIEYWRYFDTNGVIAEGSVEPISLENPSQPAVLANEARD